ncbi:MAG: hypothetical protein QOH39_2378 [Verrucomicrobiota bacterium]
MFEVLRLAQDDTRAISTPVGEAVSFPIAIQRDANPAFAEGYGEAGSVPYRASS